MRPHLPAVLPRLVGKLGDAKVVVRQANVRVLQRLMAHLRPRALLDPLRAAFTHDTWRVRGESSYTADA